MISKFIQEQKRYTQKQLSNLLEEKSEEKLISIIRKLKEYGILKLVKANDIQRDMTDLVEEDIEITDIQIGENDFYYVFTFVGVVTVAGKILKCYPKYIFRSIEPIEELKQIIKVLEKYNSKEQIIHMFNGDSDTRTLNLLALQLFLLNDYYENGLYTNSNDIIETNGTGEIFWDKTINETFALLNNNRPYYIELQTKKNVENEMDFIKRLHEIILSEISKELESADLLELFEITEIDLSDESLSDLGDNDYILYRIENELSTQYNTRKQLLLKALYAYVNTSGHLHDLDCFSMFGTNSFNLVWEKVCADILDNKLNTSLSNLELPIKLNEKYNKNDKLIDIIEKPLWSVPNTRVNDTLVPDLISIYKKNDQYNFVIFDAKYYNTVLEEGGILRGVPGIESITKQYLYQLAYKDFILQHGIQNVQNCFLMPTELENVIPKGYVSLHMLNNIGLKRIKVRMLPAKVAFDCYITGTKMNIENLKLDEDEMELPINYEEKSSEYTYDEDSTIDNNLMVAEEDEPYILGESDIFKQNIGKFKTKNGRNIYYYGEEFGNEITIINNLYKKINTLNDLFEILLKCWDKDTAQTNAQNKYIHDKNPTFGQSEITAVLVNEMYGGSIHKVKLKDGNIHFFNRINNHYIDLTKDQFDAEDIKISYEPNEIIEVGYLNSNEDILERYTKLKNKIKKLINKDE